MLRIAYLEGKVGEHGLGFMSLRDSIARVEHRMELLDQRMDGRFEAVDRRFESIERRFELMDDKMSRYFLWLVGIQVTTLIGVVGAVLSRG